MSSKALSIFVVTFLFLFCEGVTVNYAIEEEKGTNYYIGRISNGAKLREFPQITSDAEFESLRYSLLTTGNPHAQYFSVNERTSDLYTNKTINRDTLCRFLENCVLEFEVAADNSLSDFFTKISVKVNILDINDNIPTFPPGTVNIEISEASVLGTTVWKGAADDNDHGTFSVQSYQLSPDGTPFAIDTNFYADGRTEVRLTIDQSLDRETNDSFLLTLLAFDGGNPSQSGSVIISIKITDINDNTPKFENSVYNITVNEDLPENNVILRVHAEDPDEGLNGDVRYKFSALQSGDISRLFSIHSENGDIRIIQSLTQEESKKFSIIVEATDQAMAPFSPLTAKARVVVNVLDTKNTAPDVKLTTIETKVQGEYVEYAEDTKIGTVMAIVIVNDFDSGYNGAVSCTLNDDSFNLESEGNSNDYKVVLGKPLNREGKEWHEVITTCSDTGSPPLTSSDYFRLHVLDVNDVAPEFTRAVYSVSVKENELKSSSILQVHANDGDVTETPNLLYSLDLATEYTNMFSIDSTTGLIYLEQSLDREVYSRISFKVLASDNVMPKPLTGTTIVDVKVLDENDNDPIFTPLEYQFTVLENQQLGFTVGKVSALDADLGVNAEIVYKAVPVDNETPAFQVMPNGTIMTMINLDREMTYKYTFTVIASDKGVPSRSGTALVVVNVLDENDNPPYFIYPSEEIDEISVPYQSLPNTVLATIQALDPDTGINTQILYSMNGSDILQRFSLNSYTGQFSVTSQLDMTNIGSYDLVLIAKDDGNKETQRNVKLVIGDKANANMSTESETQIKYFAIAVAISCITVVLSILIVLAICLIKRKERQHQEKIAESVTTCSSLETDSEGSESRFNEMYTRGILQKPNTNSLKKSNSNPIKKPYTTVTCVDDVRTEVISDSVAIWDWSENEYGTNTEKRRSYLGAHDTEPFSTFSKTRPKNKVHWQASQC